MKRIILFIVFLFVRIIASDGNINQNQSENLFDAKKDKKKYLYSDGFYDVWWGDDTYRPYKKIRKDLLKDARHEILSQLEVKVKSVLIGKTVERGQSIEEETRLYISETVEGVLNSKYFESTIIPERHTLKKGDTLWITARLDLDTYYEELENDKKINEQKAIDSYYQAYEYYSKGKLNRCLEAMVECHYAIFNKGFGAKVDDKIDGTINTNVLSAINSMADEIKRGIVIDVLDEYGYQTNTYKILYTKSQETKDLSLEIGWIHEDLVQDIGGLEFKITDITDSLKIKNVTTNLRVRVSDRIKFDLSEYLIDDIRTNLKFKIDFDIDFNLAVTQEEKKMWRSSELFKQFNRRLLHPHESTITVEDVAFPQQKIVFIDRFLYKEKSRSLNTTQQGYCDRAKTRIKQKGGEFFRDMRGVGVTPTALADIKNTLVNRENLDETYGLDGIIELKLEREATVEELTISYFLINNFQHPMIKENVKALGIFSMGNTLVDDAVDKIFNLYLFKTIKFWNTTGVPVTMDKIKNGQKVGGFSKTIKQKEKESVKDQSRYHELTYRFSADGYRKKEFNFEADLIDLSGNNVLTPDSQIDYGIMEKKVELKKSEGTANIFIESDYPHLLYERSILDNVQITIGKRRGFLKPPKWFKPINGTLHHSYKNEAGDYIVKVSAPGFKPVKDYAFGIMDSIPVDVKVPLNYKSRSRAFFFSTLAPGSGHIYMKKLNFQKALLPFGVYSVSVAAALYTNASYNRHRSDFQTYQDISITSLDPAVYLENKDKAQKSRDNMALAKNRFLGAVASAVLTNVITSILLLRGT